VTTDSESQLVLSSEANTEYSISGNIIFTASNGVFTITEFIASGLIGSNMTLIMSSTGITSTQVKNDDTTYSDSASITLYLRNCTIGEQIGITTCNICPAPKYTIYPSSSCQICPSGATCEGGNIMYPNPGYWRSSEFSDIVYPCKFPEACSGGNSSNLIGGCEIGYTGNICQSCEIGFSRTSNGQCVKCAEGVSNIMILLVLSVFIIGIACLLVKTTLKSAFSPKALHSIYIKIFTNYLQLVFLTTQFNLKWPSTIVNLFAVQKSMGSTLEQIFSFDCYGTGNEAIDSSKAYYSKLILFAILPLGIFAISFLYWASLCLYYDTNSYIKRELFTTAIVLFFLVYPNIAKVMFSHFSCIAIDFKGNFLQENTQIECWVKDHTFYSIIVAIPSIILWAIGFPTLILVIMIKRRSVLYQDTNKVIFGFIFNGYKIQKFYWEFIIMYRKILIITISVFMSNGSTTVQALTVVIVLILSLYFQYSSKPYSRSELNYMETEALLTAVTTIYCGLYYLTNLTDEGVKLFLFFIILGGNLYFMIYWIYYVSLALLDVIVKYFPNLRNALKRGDAFEEEFYTEAISRKGSFIDNFKGIRNYTFMDREIEPEKSIELPQDYEQLYEEVYLQELKEKKK